MVSGHSMRRDGAALCARSGSWKPSLGGIIEGFTFWVDRSGFTKRLRQKAD